MPQDLPVPAPFQQLSNRFWQEIAFEHIPIETWQTSITTLQHLAEQGVARAFHQQFNQVLLQNDLDTCLDFIKAPPLSQSRFDHAQAWLLKRLKLKQSHQRPRSGVLDGLFLDSLQHRSRLGRWWQERQDRKKRTHHPPFQSIAFYPTLARLAFEDPRLQHRLSGRLVDHQEHHSLLMAPSEGSTKSRFLGWFQPSYQAQTLRLLVLAELFQGCSLRHAQRQNIRSSPFFTIAEPEHLGATLPEHDQYLLLMYLHQIALAAPKRSKRPFNKIPRPFLQIVQSLPLASTFTSNT